MLEVLERYPVTLMANGSRWGSDLARIGIVSELRCSPTIGMAGSIRQRRECAYKQSWRAI